MSDYDPYSMLTVDEPTAQEMARARAAALRGQNYAGLVMGLAHDPAAARMGQNVFQEAQAGLQDLGNLPGERLKMAMQKQQMEQAGPQPALGGLSPNVFEALTKREQVPKFAPLSMGTVGMADTRTGKVVPIPGGGMGAGGAYPDEAVDAIARKGLATGHVELPPGVRGPLAYQLGQRVYARMAQIDPHMDLAGAGASYAADKGSLATNQKVLDNAESWERTGKANLNVLLNISKKLANTGSPWINSPVRNFLQKGLGDPDNVAFKAAHNAVVNEYAKILSGSQGSGSVTEGARHEAESMLPLDATPDQLVAAANVLNQDADNRIGSAREQVGRIKARTSGAKVPAEALGPAAPAPAAAAAPAAKPDVRARIAQLKASGASAEALRATLKQEYTPAELTAAVGGGR